MHSAAQDIPAMASTPHPAVNHMEYRLPRLSDEALLQAYLQEHYAHGENSISASMGLPGSEYAAWVAAMQRNAACGDAAWGRSLICLCFDQDQLIGLMSIRYELPASLSEKMGDIGYGVRPSQRNKGYATMMLRHALSVCKAKGMNKVLLGCYRDNAASARVIQKCGSRLIAENDPYAQGKISQYYQIDL
jgi:predicted acetyltransferase